MKRLRNSGDEGSSNSSIFESNYEFYNNAVLGRLEQVQKNAHELVVEPPYYGAYSIVELRDVVKNKGIDVGVGGMATLNSNPSSISSFFSGGRTHGGGQLYVRFRPSRIN